MDSVPDYLNTKLEWFDQNPATYITDYVFCLSQIFMFWYLIQKSNNISPQKNSDYLQQRTILQFVSAYNLLLGIGFGAGGYYHQAYDMTKGPVLTNEIPWKISIFMGILAVPFAMMIPILQIRKFDKSTLTWIKIGSCIFAVLYSTEEALVESVGFSISILICIVWLVISSATIKIYSSCSSFKPVGTVQPIYMWLGAGTLIGYLLYYNSIKAGCDTWNSYPERCPFPAMFNHNAILHVLFIPAYWLMTFGWLPGTRLDYLKNKQS